MNVAWTPQPKQAVFMSRPEPEALYGGAAGGGKSDALLAEALRQVEIPHYRGILFRDTVPQLEALMSRSEDMYKKGFPKAKFNDNKKVWKFPSGAKVFFGYMQRDRDRFNYQGKSYDYIGMDELTHFSKVQYDYIKSRNRPNGPGTRVYTRATCNPDGKGMGWVKARFITPAPPLTRIWEEANVNMPDGTIKVMRRARIFVPSTVFDNQILLKNDPGYLATLANLPEAERNALLYGSWTAFTGQVFCEWRDDPEHYADGKWTHVINPLEDIPTNWNIYRGFDFGYARPFAVGWFGVAPSGKIIMFKEYYGCTGEPNVGIKLDPYQIAKNIKQIESEDPLLKGRKIYGIADPAIWNKSQGESIADMMAKSPYFITFRPGDNERLPGKMQYHYRLAFDQYGDCMFQVTSNCRHFIRTVPMLTYSETQPEDIDTSEEDHHYDQGRYVLQAHVIAPRTNVLQAIDLNDPLNQRLKLYNTSTGNFLNI